MSTKETFRERRSRGTTFARTSDAVDAFPFPRNERDQKRERNTRNRVFVNTCFSSDFASPPSFAPIEIRTRKRERMRYILLSFFRVLIRRLYRPHELRASVVSAMRIARAVLSVSRLYSSRDSTKRTTRSNSTTKKKLKKREKGAHKTYRLWCPLLERTRRRSHSKARKVVRSWCVNGSKCARARLNFVRFEKRLFFKANAFSYETPH